MRCFWVVVSLLAPVGVAAQEPEPSFDADAVLELELTSLPDVELEALRLRAERERNARHAELPALEVLPWVMIPLGGLSLLGGVVTGAFVFMGRVDLAQAAVPLLVGGALLVLTAAAWLIERIITTRHHPSWPAYSEAYHAHERLRVEQRARERRRRTRGPGRHPRRSPWY